MRHVFIVNPVAGKRNMQSRIVEKIHKYFREKGGAYEIIYSEKERDGINIARENAALGGPVRIYACGGDGTLFDVVNGAYGYPNAEVGQIPCGSGNDFLRYFGNSAEFLDIEAQVNGTAFPVDLIHCGGFYSINQCSMGMDAEIAASKKNFIRIPFVTGKMAYTIAVFYQFIKKLSSHFDIIINDEEKYSGEYLFAIAANSKYYGGGYKSAPTADPADGRLEFVMIDKVGRLKITSLLKKYRYGAHTDLDICTLSSGRVIEISCEKPSAVNMDGEITVSKSARFELVERGIKFIVPGLVSEKLPDENKPEAAVTKAAAAFEEL